MEIWLRLLPELYSFNTDSQMGLFSKKSIEWGNWEYFLYALWASAATKIIMFAYILFSLEWLMLACTAFCHFSMEPLLMIYEIHI